MIKIAIEIIRVVLLVMTIPWLGFNNDNVDDVVAERETLIKLLMNKVTFFLFKLL